MNSSSDAELFAFSQKQDPFVSSVLDVSDDCIPLSQKVDVDKEIAMYGNSSEVNGHSSDDELMQQGSQIIDMINASNSSEIPISYALPLEEIHSTQDEEKFDHRFATPLSDKEVDEISKGATPVNTLKRNQFAWKVWHSWALCRDAKRSVSSGDKYDKIRSDLLDLNVEQLNYWLGKFILEIRKKNGDYYPPKTILSIILGLQSHIRLERKLQLNFLNGPDFEGFRQTLDSELKRLSSEGYGSSPRQADVISIEDEDKLWRMKILGTHNPKVLLRTILALNGKNFAMRSSKEHRSLRYKNPQITLIENSDGSSGLRYVEDVSKTQQGGLKHMKMSKKEVIQHQNVQQPERCHIAIYKLYMSKCPKVNRDNQFYLNPLKSPKNDIWYSVQPVGVNTIARYTSDLCKEGGLRGYYTNHSWRATAATRLFEGNVPEQLIMQRTGHRSVEGVRSYKRTSEAQKRHVSDVLNAPYLSPNQDLVSSGVINHENVPSKVAKKDPSSDDPVPTSISPNIILKNCVVSFNYTMK